MTDQLRTFYNTQVIDGFFYKITKGQNGVIDFPPGYVWIDRVYNTAYYRYSAIHQYGIWFNKVFTKWDWGISSQIEFGTPAFKYVLRRIPISLSINVITMIISVPLGFLLGIIAALNKNKGTDHTISTIIMFFIAIPSFVLVTFIMLLFCYQNNILPSKWPDATAPDSYRALGYILPVTVLSLGTISIFARQTRAELCEVTSSDFLLLARTKGLTKRQAIVRHALRNSLVPLVPLIVGEFIGVLAGSMIIEQLYNIPGNGRLFVQAIGARDYNVLMADMAFYTIIGLFAALMVDLSYGLVDPRIRMGRR